VSTNSPTGTITASLPSCEIQSGQISCIIPFSWTTNNPIGTSTVTNNGANVTSGNSGVGYPITVHYGSQTYVLSNSGYQLGTQTVSASCAAGLTYNSTTGRCSVLDCVISSFTASPMSSTPGQPVILSWATNNCTSINISNGGGSNLSVNGSQTVFRQPLQLMFWPVLVVARRHRQNLCKLL